MTVLCKPRHCVFLHRRKTCKNKYLFEIQARRPRAKRRDELLGKLKEKYVIVPICSEQLGGMSTPRTSETLPPKTTGADVLDNGLRLIAPETGDDVTDFHIRGGEYSLEIAQIVGAKRAYLKGGSSSCDKDGIVGEILRRGGISVIRVG
jgi:uncharacterized protein YbbK (DUF523 family)